MSDPLSVGSLLLHVEAEHLFGLTDRARLAGRADLQRNLDAAALILERLALASLQDEVPERTRTIAVLTASIAALEKRSAAPPVVMGRCAACPKLRTASSESWLTVKLWDDWWSRPVSFCSWACLDRWREARGL